MDPTGLEGSVGAVLLWTLPPPPPPYCSGVSVPVRAAAGRLLWWGGDVRCFVGVNLLPYHPCDSLGRSGPILKPGTVCVCGMNGLRKGMHTTSPRPPPSPPFGRSHRLGLPMVVYVECLPADKPWDVVSVTRRSFGVAALRACVRVYARVLMVPPNLYIHTYIGVDQPLID